MKRILALTGAVYLLSSVSAYAGIIIEPTIVTGAPAPVFIAPPPPPTYVIAPPPAYPVQYVDRDPHRHYDDRYWRERREHEEHMRHEHEEHDEHHDDHYDHH